MPTRLLEQIKKGKGSLVDIKGRHEELSADRSSYLDSGRQYSRMTLPYVLPATTDTNRGAGANQHGFQSIGAQAVNHLANKLTMNMFPIGKSFFSLDFEAKTKALLEKAGYNVTELSELLVESEKRAIDFQNKIAARVAYTECFKSLLICGNVCAYLPKKGMLQAIKLDRYCVSRDLSGNLIELTTLQKKAFSALSRELQGQIKAIKKGKPVKNNDKVEIYTWVYRTNEDEFTVCQTAENILLREPQKVSELDLPWKPLRFNSTYGEDYGRGLVEDHAGDFYVIEFLSEALAKGMALMADIKYLVKRGSTTDIDEIAKAPTGEWVFGTLEDIGILQLERFADFTPISEVLNEYKRRVGQAFLLGSANRRDAERVKLLPSINYFNSVDIQ